MDAPAAERNVFGALKDNALQIRDGVGLRRFGQEIIGSIGGKRVHPGWIMPGSVSEPLRIERGRRE